MMQLKNLLSSKHGQTGREQGVISARKAAERLKLSHNTFFKAIAAGTIIAQAEIEHDDRTIYGFEPSYLESINKILPKHRIGGQTVFTEDIVARVKELNKIWKKEAQ